MAIARFDGTTDGSNSGWKARFYSEVGGADGHTYRVEIIDSGTAAGTFSQSESTVEHFNLVGDDDGAFLLEYDGETDNRHAPLVPSSFIIQVLEETNAHGQLFDAIQSNEDNRFGLALFIFEPDENAGSETPTPLTDSYANADGYWRPMWFGTIMADQGESKTKDSPLRTMTITAQCGLVLLNDEPFKPSDADQFEGERSLAIQIARCLDKLPTSTLWGWNKYNGATAPDVAGLTASDVIRGSASDKPVTPFFRESVWVIDGQYHMPEVLTVKKPGNASMLEHTLCQSGAFIDVKEGTDAMGGRVRERSFVSCGEVLEQIAVAFGAQIFLGWGSWWFMNPDVHIASFESGVDHKQFAFLTKQKMLANISVGHITNPLDTAALSIWERGFDLVDGIKETVMFPVKSVSSIHVEGGSRKLISRGFASATGYGFGQRYDNRGFQIYVTKGSGANDYTLDAPSFTESAAIVPGDQAVTMLGKLRISGVGAIGGSYNTDRAKGAKYKVSIKIQVGDYYLKRDIAERTETAPIKNGIGVTTNTAKFYEQSGDVEWTTAVNTYDLIFPRLDSDPPQPTVILESNNEPIEFDFVGGFHTQRRDNNQGEFKATSGPLYIGDGTQISSSSFDFAWTLPALPTGIDHEGVTVTWTFQLLDSDHDEITGSDRRDFYDPDAVMVENQQKEFAALHDFELLMGSGDDDDDVEFVAIHPDNKNTTKVVTAETVIGDKYDDTNIFRALRVKHHSTDELSFSGARSGRTGGGWVTCDNIDETGQYLHQLRANEVLQRRHKPVLMRDVNQSFTDRSEVRLTLSNAKNSFSADAFTLLHFARPLRLKYGNGVNEYFHLLELKWTNQRCSYTMAKLASSRDLSSITEADDVDKLRGPRPIGTITSDTPVSRNPFGNSGQSKIDITNALNNADVDAIKEKTDHITINSNGITGLALVGEVVRATNIQTNAQRSFATTDQLNAIASNSLTVSSHTDSIADIEDKTDLIAVTEATDLDAVRDDIDTNTTSISNIQDKTDLLTVTAATNVDNIRTTTNYISTDGNGISDFTISGSSQVIDMNNVADTVSFVKMQLTERNTKLLHILGDSTGIAGFAIKSGATPITADQVTDASSTNKFTTAANNTKLDFITVSQAVDLDTIESDVEDINVALDLANNGDAARSGQTGSEVATFSASGVLGSVSDGTRNQFLKTNGLGVLSFDHIVVPLAAMSGRVTASTTSFYFGSSSYGWNYPIWSGISFNNQGNNPYRLQISDDYAHCGIRTARTLSGVKVTGTIRNDTSTENLEVILTQGTPPNGSTSNIQMTEIDTVAVTVSAVDRHYNFEIDADVVVAANKLVFLGIRRTSGSSTRYLNFTATIFGKYA